MLTVFKPFFRRSRPEPVPPASDHNESSAMSAKLASAGSVADKYPSVRSIAVNLHISSPLEKVEPTLRGKSFSAESVACFEFHCKNVDCREGGFNIGDTVNAMIAAGESERSGRRVCEGWESSQQIDRRGCYYVMNFKINVAYHRTA